MNATGTLERSRSAPRVAPIDHDTAMRVAATEYERGDELLAQLDAGQWAAPTVNTGWDVRATVGHMVGMMDMMSGIVRMVRQQVAATRTARRADAPVSIDALTALQVRQNGELTVDELLGRYRARWPRRRCAGAGGCRPSSAAGRFPSGNWSTVSSSCGPSGSSSTSS